MATTMKTILHIFPILMFCGFLVVSASNSYRAIERTGRDARAGSPFVAAKARQSALISGLYMALAWASLAILGFVPDTGADSLTVIGCSLPMSAFMGVAVATGIYSKEKQAFELGQELSRSK